MRGDTNLIACLEPSTIFCIFSFYSLRDEVRRVHVYQVVPSRLHLLEALVANRGFIPS
jgi:hypothetical protein